ncbi:hypothetical protein C9E81_01680 [Paracoccus alkanivorans]|uniref:Uncharacterized protein n=2 Tax=Paracoccus alkanivorans TaxID=2116655 RepID=A0A3M0N1A2_9RHOB|nr:hypothetical protein C9E81_01680 [Paracoccus alkanivorans]
MGTQVKICIIGDEHAEDLKAAWNDCQWITEKYSATYILAGTMLGVNTGFDNIEVEDFDVFLLVGFSRRVEDLVHTFAYPGVSSQIRSLAVRDYWRETLLPRVTERILEAYGAPIFLMHDPMRALRKPDPAPIGAYSDMIGASQVQVFDDLSATLLRQPNFTLNGGMSTQVKYRVKGTKQVGDGADGVFKRQKARMNSAFWLAMLEALMEEIRQIRIERPRSKYA